MDNQESGTPTNSALYATDLEEAIRRVDNLYFQANKYPRAAIHSIHTAPEDVYSRGVRVHMAASFLSADLLRAAKGKSVRKLPRSGDSYAIWLQSVEQIVRSNFLSGESDARLKVVWVGVAAGVVRARILAHPEWFKFLLPVTYDSIRMHAKYFGPTIFSDYPILRDRFDFMRLTAKEIDVRLVEVLVVTLLTSGFSEEAALKMVMSR